MRLSHRHNWFGCINKRKVGFFKGCDGLIRQQKQKIYYGKRTTKN